MNTLFNIRATCSGEGRPSLPGLKRGASMASRFSRLREETHLLLSTPCALYLWGCSSEREVREVRRC